MQRLERTVAPVIEIDDELSPALGDAARRPAAAVGERNDHARFARHDGAQPIGYASPQQRHQVVLEECSLVRPRLAEQQRQSRRSQELGQQTGFLVVAGPGRLVVGGR